MARDFAWIAPGGSLHSAVHTNGRQFESILLQRCAGLSMTAREIEIVRLLGAGLSNAEIAERLFISPRTSKTTFGRSTSKAGVNQRTQLLNRVMA